MDYKNTQLPLKKILIVVGTRPEIIKTAILYQILKNDNRFQLSYCLTGQHPEMSIDFVKLFGIKPDIVLNASPKTYNLNLKMSSMLTELSDYMKTLNPDLVLVQGDTLSCYVGALTAFHLGIKIAHVEAGLRTGKLDSPFPEEGYRKMVDDISNFHFPPSATAQRNLRNEGHNTEILVFGNTGIDALLWMKAKLSSSEITISNSRLESIFHTAKTNSRKVVLLTLHRREIQNQRLEEIFDALIEGQNTHNFDIVFPVHSNPKIVDVAKAYLGERENIYLFKPLPYPEFVYCMMHADLIVTDSGGVQEEAPYLGKTTVVIREVSERKEALRDDSYLVGYDKERIVDSIAKAFQEPAMRTMNLYGDGKASLKIIEYLNSNW